MHAAIISSASKSVEDSQAEQKYPYQTRQLSKLTLEGKKSLYQELFAACFDRSNSDHNEFSGSQIDLLHQSSF